MIVEPKRLPDNFRSPFPLRVKRGHKEREFDVEGAQGNGYRLILRQSDFNMLDFSAILAISPPDSNALFRLRRYNGKSHEHTNRIEGLTFYDFHIHEATERYQELGVREDSYAEPTDRYTDLRSAIRRLLDDSAFVAPGAGQTLLFGEFDL